MNLDVVKVLSCKADGEPMVEELTFKYVSLPGRQKMEGQMLTSILGDHKTRPYPPEFQKPHLTIWAGAGIVVIAGKNEQGLVGLSADEVKLIARDIRQNRQRFFG